jgi:hypothetical protein
MFKAYRLVVNPIANITTNCLFIIIIIIIIIILYGMTIQFGVVVPSNYK